MRARTGAGFDCTTAPGGDTGLETITRVVPDVAVVDLGIDGLELARRLRANPKTASLYVIALTGYGQQADHENALRAGFDEHLVKPIDVKVLMRMVTEARDTSRRPAMAMNGASA